LALIGAAVSTASAEETLQDVLKKGYVDLGIGAGGFPYAAVSPEGKPIGAAPEISIAALKVMGITDVRPQVVDWGALIPGLIAGRYDLVSTGLFMNGERCQAVLFSQPDTCSTQAFLVPKGNPKNLRKFADLSADKSLKVTMAPGSNEVRLAKEAGVSDEQMLTNTDVQSRLKLLETGRVDVWVDPSDTFSALEGISDKFDTVQVEGAPVACAGAVFRKDSASFRDAYDEALSKVKESGEFDTILKKYGFPADLAKQQNRDALCGMKN